ncbi:hypothetical protein HYH03_002840 [Edaphochlamys debaryana]|nr:hypothetical protein HYH03_002840 [Edaphochlamys debaryana]|eukprot:KAG2499262.1 hypothetical protein HYH03_002840 [Edaphochlamys debaryana]
MGRAPPPPLQHSNPTDAAPSTVETADLLGSSSALLQLLTAEEPAVGMPEEEGVAYCSTGGDGNGNVGDGAFDGGMLRRLFARDGAKLEQLLQETQLLGPVPECRAWEGIVRVPTTLNPDGPLSSSTSDGPDHLASPSNLVERPGSQLHPSPAASPLDTLTRALQLQQRASSVPITAGGRSRPGASAFAAAVASKLISSSHNGSRNGSRGAGGPDSARPHGPGADNIANLHTASTLASDARSPDPSQQAFCSRLSTTAAAAAAASSPRGGDGLATAGPGCQSRDVSTAGQHPSGAAALLSEADDGLGLERRCTSWGTDATAQLPTGQGSSEPPPMTQASPKFGLASACSSGPSRSYRAGTNPNAQPSPTPAHGFWAAALLDTGGSFLGTEHTAYACGMGLSTLQRAQQSQQSHTSRLGSTQRFTSLDPLATSTWALLMPGSEGGGDGKDGASADRPLNSVGPADTLWRAALLSSSQGGPAVLAPAPPALLSVSLGGRAAGTADSVLAAAHTNGGQNVGTGGDGGENEEAPAAAPNSESDQLGPLLSSLRCASPSRWNRPRSCLLGARSARSFTLGQRPNTSLQLAAAGGSTSAATGSSDDASRRPAHRFAPQRTEESAPKVVRCLSQSELCRLAGPGAGQESSTEPSGGEHGHALPMLLPVTESCEQQQNPSCEWHAVAPRTSSPALAAAATRGPLAAPARPFSMLAAPPLTAARAPGQHPAAVQQLGAPPPAEDRSEGSNLRSSPGGGPCLSLSLGRALSAAAPISVGGTAPAPAPLLSPTTMASSPRLLQFATSLSTAPAPISGAHNSSRTWARRSSNLVLAPAGSTQQANTVFSRAGTAMFESNGGRGFFDVGRAGSQTLSGPKGAGTSHSVGARTSGGDFGSGIVANMSTVAGGCSSGGAAGDAAMGPCAAGPRASGSLPQRPQSAVPRPHAPCPSPSPTQASDQGSLAMIRGSTESAPLASQLQQSQPIMRVPSLTASQHQLGKMQQQERPARQEGPAQGSQAVGLAWHEVRAAALVDPCSGARFLVVMQKDVTAKVEAERHIAQVSETEHRLLEQVFPRHVLAYMTEQGFDQPQPQPLQPALSAAADGSAQLNPAWRPCVRDCTQLATWHPQVTVLFADIQGFTPMCKELPAAVVMKFLNDLFVRFDSLLDAYGVYKVETIGDCYVVAGGLIGQDADGMAAVQGGGESDPQQADRVFGFAQAMLRAAACVALPTTGEPVRIRVGIHSGAVVSGVVGTRMPRFCLFGDTVNTASRMESTSRAGCIHASSDTFAQLSSQQQPGWDPTGGVEVKGKGLMETFMWSPP